MFEPVLDAVFFYRGLSRRLDRVVVSQLLNEATISGVPGISRYNPVKGIVPRPVSLHS